MADPSGEGPGFELSVNVISSLCTSGYSPSWCFSQEMEKRRATPVRMMPAHRAKLMNEGTLTSNPATTQPKLNGGIEMLQIPIFRSHGRLQISISKGFSGRRLFARWRLKTFSHFSVLCQSASGLAHFKTLRELETASILPQILECRRLLPLSNKWESKGSILTICSF